MTLNEQYVQREEQIQAFLDQCQNDIWTDQESRYIHPFQIFGNIYYVGDIWVCVHLIDTGDGLLLLDSGNCGATAMLIHSIWEAGFNPADVRWIIHSHGHADHIGGANFMKRMFGSKLYLGEPDAHMFCGRPWLSTIQQSPNLMDRLFEPDEFIQDGDELTFGNTTIQFRLVPGHTAGCIACFFNATDGTQVKRAGYYGGFGLNTLTRSMLEQAGDPTCSMRETYLESLSKVRDEPVDIFLGNHTENNNLLYKRAVMLAHPEQNPFLDPNAWRNYLDNRRHAMLQLMQRDPASPS